MLHTQAVPTPQNGFIQIDLGESIPPLQQLSPFEDKKVEIWWLFLTSDREHHASDLVADGVAGDALIAPSVNSARILHLQETLLADVELATFCHLYTILRETERKDLGPGATTRRRPT